jgi:hypothetical protein
MPTGDLTLFKIMLNSVISIPGAQFMSLDIKKIYLNTPMSRYEYVHIRINDVPKEIIKQYNLHEKIDSEGYVYIEVRKGDVWLTSGWNSCIEVVGRAVK